ncbi:MAG: hypothetical protein ACRDYZ_14920, partial [Acidimicrobiales bacterium]
PVPGPVTAVATSTPGLAFTGGPGLAEVLGGLGLGVVGGGLMLATRRRRPRHAAGRSDGGAR